ncbi:DinB family protein [Flavobacterium microcysteis]|uniref:DinB family protein n=1 Tax=Flavobacterium microcysteis TaxID=2596891 RepID=A0A501Q301_9FLAO|nr:DinB family protein [Flavobacterium microcysteis]TPD67259.1 DinB family protein [Flavobacterium microcysteis]
MKITTASNRMFSLLVLYDMQTLYFERALDKISDEDAHKRLDTKANHIAWLSGSLVQQRYEIANLLGYAEEQKAVELFKEGKGIQDNVKYPSLSQFLDDWKKISPILKDLLAKITDQKLDEKFEMMPGMSLTYYELITFIIYREANCIGQIALWRRLLGYDALRYDDM